MSHLNEMIRLPQVWFYAFGAAVVAFALVVVLSRNIVHCAMSLAAAFIGVAAIYLLFDAAFLAAVQVLIYVGAVTVLILFAILLSEKILGEPIRQHNRQMISALPLIVLLVAGIISHVGGAAARAGTRLGAEQADGVREIGLSLLGPHVLPFEIASLMLLVAMVGAIVISRKD